MTADISDPDHPTLADYLLLLALAAIWGSSFMFIKIAVETLPPASTTALRIAIGALVLLATTWLAGQTLPRGWRIWGLILVAGLFGNALPFTLISWGEERIDSGLAAILMALMPLTTVVLAHYFTRDEPMTAPKAAGVLLGIVGLVVLIGPSKLASLGHDTLRQLAVAAAAVSYSINALVTKSLLHLPRRSLAAAVMLASTIIMVPAAVVMDQPWTLDPSIRSLAATVILGLLQTAIATLLMFAMIRRRGASFFSQINFMVPLFGVVWGALVLAERPSVNAYLALVIILLGIAIARRSMAMISPTRRGPPA